MSSNIGGKVSVCLLTYNHVDVIQSTLNSILEQSITGYEVIISDDCSTDGTWELVQELAENNPQIRTIKTPYNMGMASNANFAVTHSVRPYIALLHHDDLYQNDLLEKWCAIIEQSSDIAFVFNAYGVNESDYIYAESIPAGRIDGRWLLESFLFPRWGCVVRGTAMIRRDLWNQVGGMREKFGLLADIDLWMRLSMVWAAGYEPEPIIMVRHQRPLDYPNEYKGEIWSWARRRYLYEVHAENRLTYYDLENLKGKLNFWWFRFRLNMDTTKWLTYAVVKGNYSMILSAKESETPYDFWVTHVYRRVLMQLFKEKHLE